MVISIVGDKLGRDYRRRIWVSWNLYFRMDAPVCIFYCHFLINISVIYLYITFLLDRTSRIYLQCLPVRS